MDKNIILYGLGAAAVYGFVKYKKAYDVANKLTFTFKEFSYDQAGNSSITISFYVDVKNPTNENIVIRNSSLECYLNSIYAGKAFIPYTQVVKANSTTKIIISTTIYYKNVFSDWWQPFLTASTSVHLTVAGSIRFNGVLVPSPSLNVAEFNLQQAIEKINGISGIEKAYVN